MNFSLSIQTWIKIAACLFIPLLFYQFVYLEIKKQASDSQQRSADILRQMESFDLAGQEYEYLNRINVIPPRISTSQVINTILEKYNISDTPEISEVQATGYGRNVQVRFNRLRNDELIELVYGIENHTPVIRVRELTIKPSIASKNHITVSLLLGVE